MKLYEKIYDWGRILFWILYAVTILDLWNNAPHYLEKRMIYLRFLWV